MMLQDHSKSSKLVTIGSLYASSY